MQACWGRLLLIGWAPLIARPWRLCPDFPPPLCLVQVLVAQCGKLQLLDRLLRELKAGGHKVLIFSQVRQLVSGPVCWSSRHFFFFRVTLCKCLPWAIRLTSKPWPLTSVAQVFLLSTRAGGLGINLTAADTCIIYDSDWCVVWLLDLVIG